MTKTSVIAKLSKIYSHQVDNSKARGYLPPEYSRKEFIDKFKNDIKFLDIFNLWIDSGCDKNLSPSFDRNSDYDRYTFKTITVMTWRENNQKAHRDRKNGNNNKVSKAIIQLDKLGNILNEFHSVSEASRKADISRQNIARNLRGDRPTAGGFRWILKENYIEEEVNDEIEFILQYDKKGNMLKKHFTIADATKDTGVTGTNINNNLSGRSKSAGGFVWKRGQDHL